jgi:transposase
MWIHPELFVFVDESGNHTSMCRDYGRAVKGQRAYSSKPRNRGPNLTLIAALAAEGIQAPWVIEGGVDGEAFALWVEQSLVPTLGPGQIVVMDNLKAHKQPTVKHLIGQAGCTVLFLPSYSPDFNPIELAFGKIKAFLRTLAARTYDTLSQGIADAFRTISTADIRGWFGLCGYNVNYQ